MVNVTRFCACSPGQDLQPEVTSDAMLQMNHIISVLEIEKSYPKRTLSPAHARILTGGDVALCSVQDFSISNHYQL